jgi:hypothetical protein
MGLRYLRSCIWIVLAFALAAPAHAVDLVGKTSVRFAWTAATGPVASYAVFVSRNGAAFPTAPTQTVSATEATLTGAYGDTLQIQVAARNAAGDLGPMSPISDLVRFVAPPVLTLGATLLTASAPQGQTPATQTFTIRNTGGSTLAWSVSESLGWLSLAPASGTTTTETDSVTVSFVTTGLAQGTYNGSITVSATGLPSQTIAVRLDVGTLPPALVISTTSLSATAPQGQSPAARSFTVRNGGGGTLSWSVSESSPWLALAPESGSATTETDTVTVSFAASALAVGTHTASIAVSATGLPSQTIAVSLTVTPPPSLQLSTNALSLVVGQGNTLTVSGFTIRNVGSGTLGWSVSDDAAWLTASPASGSSITDTDSISLTVDATALVAGSYTANVVVSAPGALSAPGTVVVTLEVQPPLGAPGKPEVVDPLTP